MPLDCCTITLLEEDVLALLLLLGCGFVEIVPDEMWSIMEQGHVHWKAHQISTHTHLDY